MTIRLNQITNTFKSQFDEFPLIITRAPGRAEIIGNHTDYNFGFALGAALKLSTYCAISPRKDNQIHTFSTNLDTTKTVFGLSEINQKQENHWTNYLKAVCGELNKLKIFTHGFNLLIIGNVPHSGGISSSAALEISMALCLSRLFEIQLPTIELALLCQKAENGPLIDSPCGFLDQGTSLLATQNNLIFFDFLPGNNLPVSEVKHIPFNLNNVAFVIAVDKKIKRNLGQSGYPARRKSCEKSLPVLSKLLHRKITSLRNISLTEFEKYKDKLNNINKTMRMRIEHIVNENQRVLNSIKALQNNDLGLFGEILNKSGDSALNLYELDEKTPELTFLLNKARNIDGVIGVRNMGGGFSANIIALVRKSDVLSYQSKIDIEYKNKYNSNLQFITFHPAQGAQIYEV